MHINKGKTIAQCLSDRTDYVKNPEKTENGALITSFACDPHTVDAEFMLAKRQYEQQTGRQQKNDVIAYQVRQSFKPGEVTPEEANKIGYEFAQRFLKGKHAFIVCTHTDKAHIHNHIIWNSTTLDCNGKYRDFLGSGKTVARLSDMICLEHQLSVIENPHLGSNGYRQWLDKQPNQQTHRDRLRQDIDWALAEKPADFDAFLHQMKLMGYTIKLGANVTFSHPDFERNIRLCSLGSDYSEERIRARIAGKVMPAQAPEQKPKPQKTSLLIDIQKKLSEGKGSGYKQWATVFNLKQMAKTLLYLQEHGPADYDQLVAQTDQASEQIGELRVEIRDMEQRMAEIKILRTHIINYSKTRSVYVGYRKAGYSKKYLAEHESDIILHKAAKKAFDGMGITKLPTVKGLNAEYAELLAKKKSAYAEYHALREEQRELLIHRTNVERFLGVAQQEGPSIVQSRVLE